jgi:ribonuclease HI
MDPIRIKKREINNEIAQPTIQPLACATRPPWQLRPSVIDTTIREKIRDADDLPRRRALVEDHIRNYEDHVAVYTDGSRNAAGRVSCAFYVPSCGHHVRYRMSDFSSVLSAEMEAISRAIEWATITNTCRVVVFSDSLGVIQSLERRQSETRPQQLADLMYALDGYTQRVQSPATIVWVPGHLGIVGNETADTLCKQALHHDTVDIPTTLEYKEARSIYRDHFLRKWQSEWTNSNTGADYRALEPTVSLTRKYANLNRKEEVTITRLERATAVSTRS